MRSTHNALTALAGLAAAALLAACGGGSSTGGGVGTLSVGLTDAPACGFDHVYVTVERVRIHASSNADDSTRSGWTDIAVNPPRRIDLLTLTNGRMEPLGLTEIAAGDYTQVRLLLVPNRGNNLANSIVPTGGSEVALDTPSAVQTGIKVIRPFTVAAGRQVDLVLDFDACRSIVQRGNGSYGLKPVVTGHLVDVAVIAGRVTNPAGVLVSVQKDGEVIRSTVPVSGDGSFRVPFLDASRAPYDVVITAAGRSTAVVSGVPAAVGNTTQLGSVPMPLPASSPSTGVVNGTLGPIAARDDGEVRALQAVGPASVEIAFRNVDDLTGAYVLMLSTEAPRHAPYTTTPLVFSTQTGAAGRYTLQARAGGFAPFSPPLLTVAPGSTQTVDFTLAPLP